MSEKPGPRFLLLLLFLPILAGGAPPPDEEPLFITGDRLMGRDLRSETSVLTIDGNVRFLDRSRGVAAFGDRGVWRETGGILRLEGAARVYRGGGWSAGPEAVLDLSNETLTFDSGVLIVDANRTIAADRGLFFFGKEGKGDRVLLTGDVAVIDTARFVLADTLEFRTDDEEGIALGDVHLELLREFYRVRGREARFLSDRIVVTRAAVAEELDSLGRTTGTLRGDTLVIEPDSERITAIGSTEGAYDEVRTFAARTVMEGDSSAVYLSGDPSLEREGETMRGDSIAVRFSADGDEVERVEVIGNASLASVREDSIRVEKGGVRAERITLRFEKGELHTVEAVGGAASDRSVEDRAAGTREGNQAVGDTIRFFFKDEELEEIRVAGSASGDNLSGGIDQTTEEEEKEKTRYRGDEVRFDVVRNRVYLSGSAHVERGTMKLDADRIRYEIDRSIVTAQGSPVLQDADQRVDGERMVYNVDKGQGTIYDGVTKYEQGICYGSKIHRLNDKTLLLEGGRYTSCEEENPHYYFRADRMKIYLDDKTVVRPIVLHIADIPLLALPHYLFPLKGGRASGFLLPNIEFGFSESKGRFIRNGGYFWAVNDYADLTFRGDFFQNSHWIAYLDARYRVRYLLGGSARSSYQSSAGGRKRWSVQADHNQELGENLDLTMRANFVSDKLYRVEQSTTLQELDRTLKSDLVLKKRWKDMSFSGQLTRTEQLDRDRIDETLPSLQFTMNRRELFAPPEARPGEASTRRWYNDIYYQYSSRLLNSREKNGDVRKDRAGWGHDVSTNLSRRFGEWLGYSARMQWSETWYDRDALGQKQVRRGMWSASTSVNTNVYGTFFPRIGPLVGLRHIITPAFSFTYRPKNPNHFYVEDGVEKDRFTGFGGFGASQRAARSFSLSLDNKLQTKYLAGGEERKNDQLLMLSNSIAYDLEKDRSRGEKPWSDLSSSLRFQPVNFFNSEASVSHDPYGWAFRSFSARSGFRFDGTLGPGAGRPAAPATEEEDAGLMEAAGAERSPFEDPATDPYRGDYRSEGRRTQDSSVIPWNLQVSHSFSRGARRGNFTQWLNTSLGLGLTSGWDVDYENRYDLEERKTVSQGFRIRRDLHCWEASFRGRYSGREWEYYFNVRIRAHPEIYYEKGERRLGY